MGWEQVKSNSGACGVDGITVKVFAKDSQRRLLAVREQIKEDRYQAQLIKRYFDTLGLFNLEAAQALERSSLRNGVKR